MTALGVARRVRAVKAGDLERNLTRLVEVAKAAQACLATVEGEVSALRLALHAEVPEVVTDLGEGSGAGRDIDGAAAMEAAYK